ncbi:hypothetical protein QQS21_012908, partial [Conoideocrella luteorostrata]
PNRHPNCRLHPHQRKILTQSLTPDIDPAPSEASLAAAKALIEAELPSTPSPQLPPFPPPKFSPAIDTELARIASSTALQHLDTKRYEAQELPPAEESSTSTLQPVLSRAYTSHSYLTSRVENLKLLDKHGSNAWLISNYHLENELRSVEKELADTKRQIDEINNLRARRQGEVKGEMNSLEETWKKGVGRVLETEIAVGELKAEIRDELRRRSAQE